MHKLLMKSFVALILWCPTAYAANFSLTKSGGILIEGPIVMGDAEKLRSVLIDKNKYVLQSVGIQIDSLGGDLIESIRMGELIYVTRSRVRVKGDGICASACFFIWINGSRRLASGYSNRSDISEADLRSGVVGLHRPYLTLRNETSASAQKQLDAMLAAADYLKKKMLPQEYIDIMMSKSSRDVYWLERKDLDRLGSMPMELEELYISKCGSASHAVLDAAISAADAGDKSTVRVLRKKYEKTQECEEEADRMAIDEGIKKLKGGWMPSRIIN